MKKIFILVLMVLVGISLIFVNVKADEARTIPYKSVTVAAAHTVVFTHGVVVYKITGYASSGNATFGLYNTTTTAGAVSATCMVEGGQATQYNSLNPMIDFGEEGLNFDTGLVAITTTMNLAIVYR